MKKVLALVIAASMLVGAGYSSMASIKAYADQNVTAKDSTESKNLIKNGDFSNGTKNWDNYNQEGGEAKAKCEDGAYVVDITDSGTETYSIQVSQKKIELKKGATYELSFDISSTVDRDMYYCLQKNSDDYKNYFGEEIKLTSKTQTVKTEFTMDDDTDLSAALAFNLGTYSDELEEHSVTIDNVKLVEVGGTTSGDEDDKKEENNIIKNGDFSNGDKNWNNYNQLDGEATVNCEDGAYNIDIKNAGTESYAVQVAQKNIELKKGSKYELSFDISSTVERDMYYCLQENGGDYKSYFGEEIELTPETQTVKAQFTMDEDTDLAATLAFNLGIYRDELDEHSVTIDNVKLVEVGGSTSSDEDDKKEENNIIKNGDFSNGDKNWNNYNQLDGEATVNCEDGAYNIDIKNAGTESYAVQVAQKFIELKKGSKYELSFDISSTVERKMYYCLQENGGDYKNYFGQEITLDPDTQTVKVNFTMEEDTDLEAALAFNLGTYGEDVGEHSVTIDNVKLVEVGSTSNPGENEDKDNLIKNGDFSNGMKHWNNYNSEGGKSKAVVDGGELKTTITDCGTVSYGVQITQNNFELKQGGVYELEFDISSTIERDMYYCIQMNGGDYKSYTGDQIKIDPETKKVKVQFTMTDETDKAPALAFNLGMYNDEVLPEHTVTIDNVSLKLVSYDNPEIKLGVNLLKNSDFSEGMKHWDSFTAEGGKGKVAVEDGALKAKITDNGTVPYSIQVSQKNFPLYKNGKYELKFDISSTVEREIYFCTQMNSDTYASYAGEQVKIGPDTKTVTLDFTMEGENDIAPALAFNIGNVGEQPLDEHTITLDNVSLVLTDATGVIIPPPPVEKEEGIVLNQVGYLPEDSKKVVFRGKDLADKEFNVVNADTEEVVYTGEISAPKYNKSADETDYFGDFSSVKEPGNYKITTATLGESFKFEISKDAYKEALKQAVRFFYMQRCGEELPEDKAGVWAHPACQDRLARVYGTDDFIDVTGGWHDAGDYGRYTVATSKTLGDLMLAYNTNKSAFGDDTNIPESGNGIADILDEVKGQLVWLFKMQNPANGGVHHKVTCAGFPGNVKPEEEIGELIVTPETTTATGDFAAAMALGYETFKDLDPEFADKCLDAAEKAWDYLDAQPAMIVTNPEGITTGEYGDEHDTDERYWAAAQLFKATGKEKYNERFKEFANKKIETGYDWQSVGNYGNEAYLSAKGADKETCDKIKAMYLKEAARIVKASKDDSYSVTQGMNYWWGSNMAVLSEASLLNVANNIKADPEFMEYAKEHVNYIFGKNANAISFVSGTGTVSPQHPHHRPSTVAKQAVPGMLAGGVNSGLEDPMAEAYLDGKAPAKCYIDNAESYSTNEVDIYWNSSLVRGLIDTQRVANEGNGDNYSDTKVKVTVDTDVNNAINQNYEISCDQDEAIDLSKVAVRYYFNKSDATSMEFHAYDSAIGLTKAPWYVSFVQDTTGTFGSDEKGNYVEIKINNPFELENGMGPVKIKTCVNNKDWSAIKDFEDNGVVVLYDGKVVK